MVFEKELLLESDFFVKIVLEDKVQETIIVEMFVMFMRIIDETQVRWET